MVRALFANKIIFLKFLLKINSLFILASNLKSKHVCSETIFHEQESASNL